MTKETENHYRRLFDNVPIGLYHFTPDWRIVDANSALVQMLGYPDRESLCAVNLTDIYADVEVLKKWQIRLEREGILPEFNVQYRRFDGSVFWAENSGRAVKNAEDGQILFYEGSIQNIEERRHFEEYLRESEARLFKQNRVLVNLAASKNNNSDLLTAVQELTEIAAHTLDIARVSVWLYSENKSTIRSIDLYESKFNRHSAGIELNRNDYPHYFEALETEPSIVAHDAHGDERTKEFSESYLAPLGITSMLDAPIRVGGQIVGVLCHEHTGAARHWRLDEQNFADSIAGAISIAMEKHERRQAEDNLRLTEEQLRQAQKMEAFGQLAGGVAHDFNNLLTVINGYSDIVIRQLDRENPLRQKVEEIKNAGERAAALTYQLLAFSRQQVLQPKILDINDVVLETAKLLQRLIGEDIQLITTLNPKIGKVKADPGQLSQVIINLAVNARDAMPHGGTLTIETANAFFCRTCGDENPFAGKLPDEPDSCIVLSIRDSGGGMDAETQGHIFEPFFTTKEAGKGTGLGLSTVYGIVEQSGGSIAVQSKLEQGTTFNIYLLKAVEESENIESEDNELPFPLGTENILLVEDEQMVRELTRQVLETCGYLVESAANGAEALAYCEKDNCGIDLLITDVVMPVMGGRELAQRMAEIRPTLRVLFMSGYTDDAVVRHGVVEGVTHFIQKPFTLDELAYKVREVLDAPPNK